MFHFPIFQEIPHLETLRKEPGSNKAQIYPVADSLADYDEANATKQSLRPEVRPVR
jgi:hypothetical protein